MPLISLKEDIVVNWTDGEGKLLRASTGECFALDPIASLLLKAALQIETIEEAEQFLASYLDAGSEQIREGMVLLREQLTAADLLLGQSPSPEDLMPPNTSPDIGGHLEEASLGRRIRRLGARPRTSRDTVWDVFLTGRQDNPPLPTLPFLLRLTAYGHMLRVLLMMGKSRVFSWLLTLFRLKQHAERVQQREWPALARYLSAIPVLSSAEHGLSAEACARLARRELVWCQLGTRLLAPTGVCLIRSAAFCAYLRALGIPAQVIVAQGRFGSADGYPFHAWVEVEAIVVNDLAEVQSGYVEWQRIPRAHRDG